MKSRKTEWKEKSVEWIKSRKEIRIENNRELYKKRNEGNYFDRNIPKSRRKGKRQEDITTQNVGRIKKEKIQSVKWMKKRTFGNHWEKILRIRKLKKSNRESIKYWNEKNREMIT